MIPATFDYVRATSLDQALTALADGGDTKVIAGGQSLLPLLRFRLAALERLIDIGALSELKGINATGDMVQIGAATTYRELLESTDVSSRFPIIAEATATIGDIQVRNCGTVGGSLAHADPASDMPAVMLALDARFVLKSTSGDRMVAARDFFTGPFETAIADNELLTTIQIPNLVAGTGTAYVCFEQKASGYALVGAAAVVTMSAGKVTRADVGFTGLADTPFIAADVAGLVGTDGGNDAIETVSQASVAGVEPNDDIHAPAEYRRHLGGVAARRALQRAVERAG